MYLELEYHGSQLYLQNTEYRIVLVQNTSLRTPYSVCHVDIGNTPPGAYRTECSLLSNLQLLHHNVLCLNISFRFPSVSTPSLRITGDKVFRGKRNRRDLLCPTLGQFDQSCHPRPETGGIARPVLIVSVDSICASSNTENRRGNRRGMR